MISLKNIFELEKIVINYLENSELPLIYFILTFFSAVNLRNLIEVYFVSNSIINIELYKHYTSFSIALAMSLIILFAIITKAEVVKIAKVILPSFIILVSVPLFDLIINSGNLHYTEIWQPGYMIPGIHDDIVIRFFTFFGDFKKFGITPGMRLEIALVLLFSFIFFRLKNLPIFKCFVSTILTYFIIFLFLSTPFIIKCIFDLIKIAYSLSDSLIFNFYVLIIFITGVWLTYLTNGEYFVIIINDIRPFRLIHFELMYLLGLIVGSKFVVFNFDYLNIFNFVFTLISIAFAWLFSVLTNNIEDYNIDKISNQGRPLINSNMNVQMYKKLSWAFLLASIFFAIIVNFRTAFIITLFIGNYFLYSIPPFRFKRIPFFSKLFISLNSILLVILGFLQVTNSLQKFPKPLFYIFLLGFTAAINFIDLKDFEGDKQSGIKTLPVLFGLKKAKVVIGIFFIICYLSIYQIIRDIHLIIPLFFIGILQFYLINKKKYNEKYVFLTYLLSLTSAIIYLIHSKNVILSE